MGLGEAVLKPEFPWEFVQIGNCGSPIELDEGWLLFTHGVGPVRRYSIGAVLPDKIEREGYVLNVVYTCGALRMGERIVLPYAISDTFSTVATVRIDALLKNLALT